MARLQLVGPAIALMITAALAVVFWAVMAWGLVVGERHWWRGDNSIYLWSDLAVGALAGLMILAAAGTMCLGARWMMNLRKPAWVFLAVFLALLPWSGAVLVGLPVGLWALWVLNRPNVKAAFARNAFGNTQRSVVTPWNSPAVEPQPTGPFRRKLRSMLQGMQSLFLGSRVKNNATTDWTAQGTDER